MKSWKDAAVAAIGVSWLAVAFVYLFVFAPPHSMGRSNIDAVSPAPRLYPACDYFPDRINGTPCVDADEFARTGQLVFCPERSMVIGYHSKRPVAKLV
jgi:hypothetical protein